MLWKRGGGSEHGLSKISLVLLLQWSSHQNHVVIGLPCAVLVKPNHARCLWQLISPLLLISFMFLVRYMYKFTILNWPHFIYFQAARTKQDRDVYYSVDANKLLIIRIILITYYTIVIDKCIYCTIISYFKFLSLLFADWTGIYQCSRWVHNIWSKGA